MNLSTFLILIVLIAVVVLIIFKLILDKKKGKTNCGSNCSNCALSQTCHKKEELNDH